MDGQVRMIGSAEFQLVQATLRVDAGRDAALCAVLRQALDWTEVQRQANYHGVLPLVCQRLLDAGQAPLAAMHPLTIWQKANELRVARMSSVLVEVVRSLDAAGIPVLCLKGPAFAALAYGSPSMRSFADLDVLVNEGDYTRVAAVLQGMGATLSDPEHMVSLARDRHSSFRYGSSYLEIHWRVTTKEFPRALASDGLFARAQAVTLHGKTLASLGVEDSILYAGLHGMQHCWGTWRFLADFATALSTISPERWHALYIAAHEQGLGRVLLVAMGLCRDLLGLKLPEEITRALPSDRRARWAARYVTNNLIRAARKGQDVLDAPTLYLLLTEERHGPALVGLLAGIFRPTATDFAWVRLPAHLRWLYHVLRPVRLLGRGVRAVRRRVNFKC